MTDVEQDELFVVLEGRATIEVEGGADPRGRPRRPRRARKGARTTWTIHEPLRKVFQITLHDD